MITPSHINNKLKIKFPLHPPLHNIKLKIKSSEQLNRLYRARRGLPLSQPFNYAQKSVKILGAIAPTFQLPPFSSSYPPLLISLARASAALMASPLMTLKSEFSPRARPIIESHRRSQQYWNPCCDFFSPPRFCHTSARAKKLLIFLPLSLSDRSFSRLMQFQRLSSSATRLYIHLPAWQRYGKSRGRSLSRADGRHRSWMRLVSLRRWNIDNVRYSWPRNRARDWGRLHDTRGGGISSLCDAEVWIPFLRASAEEIEGEGCYTDSRNTTRRQGFIVAGKCFCFRLLVCVGMWKIIWHDLSDARIVGFRFFVGCGGFMSSRYL